MGEHVFSLPYITLKCIITIPTVKTPPTAARSCTRPDEKGERLVDLTAAGECCWHIMSCDQLSYFLTNINDENSERGSF